MAMTIEQQRAMALAKARQRKEQAQSGERDSWLGKADTFMRGAADMMSFGLADEISAGLGSLTGIGGEQGEYSRNLATQRATDRQDAEERGGYRLGGQVIGGVTGGAGLAKSGLSASANAIRAGKPLSRVAAASAGEGAALGAMHGAGSGEGLEDRARGAGVGAVSGTAIGAAAPYATSAISKIASRLVSPMRIAPERVAAMKTLKQDNIPVSAGQLSGSRRLRFAESELGRGGTANLMDKQQDAFTSAVLRRAGINATRATPEVMDEAFTKIGQQFDDLAAKNTLRPDRQMVEGLREVFNEYGAMVPESMRSPIVQNVVGDIVEAAQRGPISGTSYQNLSSRLAKAARGASNPDLRNVLYGIRETLDDAMERSIAQTNPAQVGAWREVRNQYRNLLAVEKAASRAGEAAAEGIISPANIRNAAVQQGKRSYVRGKGDFADLARSGTMLMNPLPDSGTAGRLNAQNIGTGITTLLGAGAGGAMGGGPGAMAGMVAGSAVPRAAGAALMSRPVQSYLSNQLLAEGVSPQIRAIANAALNNQLTGQNARYGPLRDALMAR